MLFYVTLKALIEKLMQISIFVIIFQCHINLFLTDLAVCKFPTSV